MIIIIISSIIELFYFGNNTIVINLSGLFLVTVQVYARRGTYEI